MKESVFTRWDSGQSACGGGGESLTLSPGLGCFSLEVLRGGGAYLMCHCFFLEIGGGVWEDWEGLSGQGLTMCRRDGVREEKWKGFGGGEDSGKMRERERREEGDKHRLRQSGRYIVGRILEPDVENAHTEAWAADDSQ